MENGIRRWLVNIRDWNPSEDEFSSLISLLPPHEHSHITRFIKSDDQKRALVSRILQYSLVHEVLGIPFDKIVIHRTIEGKPFLQNGQNLVFPNFNFNASHHGDYVGIVSEPVCLVGLDIMSISIPKKETAVEFIQNFSPYFTDFEWKNIIGAGDLDEILATFYRYNIEITNTIWREIFKYWCLKESFVKALGCGIGFGLQRLEFHHTNWTNISVYVEGVRSRDWSFSLFKLDDRHWASIARGHPKEAPESYKRTSDTSGFILRTIDQIIPSHFECESCVPVNESFI